MSSFLLAVLMIFGATQQGAVSKWKVNKLTDPMTDKQQVTLVLPSDDGLASLRVTCSDDGQPTALFTLPKGNVIQTGFTFLELRFDKAEPKAYLVQELKLAVLITSLGGPH